MSAVTCSKILDWDWDAWLFHYAPSNSEDMIFCIVIVGAEKISEILRDSEYGSFKMVKPNHAYSA